MWQKFQFLVLVLVSSLSFLQAQSGESKPPLNTKPTVDTEIAFIEGRVLLVTDGDQLRVKTDDGKVYAVRLHGVDAPEQDQEHGANARKELEGLVLDKDVKVVVHRTDSKGLYMGTVFLNGQDIGLRMLEKGNGWHYKRVGGEQSSDVRAKYAMAELKAREAKAGLWSALMPIPPWEFREEIGTPAKATMLKAEPVLQTENAPATPAAGTSQEAKSGRVYILGPRGGCYYLNPAGTKVYVKDKSLCPKP